MNDVLILGGGPAGLTAAIYTSRASLKTMIIAGNPPGGQLTTTTDVENFPGFPEGVMGPELISKFREQAQRFGTQFVDENVVEISGDGTNGFEVVTDEGNKYSGKCVIIATGASAKWLGLESEQKLRGKGVSACATCDGFFFKDKVVGVVGGGDAAMEEATFLTKFAPKVYVFVRGTKENLKASKFMQDRAMSNPKIEFLYNTEIKEVLGEDSVEGLKIINNQTNQESTLDDVQGLFVAIGHKPNTEFLDGFIDLGRFGYIEVTDNTKTTKEGVFVGGDAADYKYRQAVTAAGYGCMAALDAEKFLAERSV
ncbi:thioredoxin-disulfide reductase [bacterium]|nr:thioredoxin-disulfide reductase [bacterium]